ncbi:MAG: hypothetical protein H7175_24165 [Burkholderiales bacterium]|nr:hypothetical protein [Anaerolineae bacterium]
MSAQTDLSTLLQHLRKLRHEATDQREPKAMTRLEKEVVQLYDQLVGAYLKATETERAVIWVNLELRDRLLTMLVRYLENVSQQALKANEKDNKALVRDLLRRAVVADLLIDSRLQTEALKLAQRHYLNLAYDYRFDTDALSESLHVSAATFVQLAWQYQREQYRVYAVRALGRALQQNRDLEDDPEVIALAMELTDEAEERDALRTLADSYVREEFIRVLMSKAVSGKPEAVSLRRTFMSADHRRFFMTSLVAFAIIGLGIFIFLALIVMAQGK